MRPSLLDPLFAPADTIAGIGPKIAPLIERVLPLDLGERPARVGDLLFLLPHSAIDRRNRPGIAGSANGSIVTLDLRIDRHQPPPRANKSVPYRVFGHDETGEIALTFFRGRSDWLNRMLPVDGHVTVSGRMEWFNGRPSMVHPDHIALAGDTASLPLVEPVYPLTAGLSPKLVRRVVGEALERLPAMPEWLDTEIMRRRSFPDFPTALLRIHLPEEPVDVSPDNAAWRRLAYDELLAGQIALALVRARMKSPRGRQLTGNGQIRQAIRDALPYTLTGSQEAALSEIEADLGRPERMLRLLQGDVGSGKTVVGLMAMAQAAEAGTQSALLAPTEILARQHYATIAPIAADAGLAVGILTGREKGRERTRVLEGLADGTIQIVVGTHALFQEPVAYRNLALAVIDEQHRFGVHQRLALSAKGETPDMLVMTATPIPRTLVLTAFGDMDVSRLTDKPPGRKPIRTVAMPIDRFDDLIVRLRAAVSGGQKVYWICPLVEESEEVRLMSAESRYEALASLFPGAVGLVHGRMKGAAKDEVMQAFKNGGIRILVATTVIEVGVDVPDATIIVIEHAERFGLAQLHQLRGRVGRGDRDSSCILLYKAPLGEVARQRLAVLRDSDDGFEIAEQDLKLRGEGEILGTRQSGTPGFIVARLEHHADLLETARDDARLLLTRDAELQSGRRQAIRLLLYLFGRDDAVRLLRAG